MANDDLIYLEGQAFPTIGQPRANAISDFEIGIKVGSTTYDNREHAFFLVLEDFTGGFGDRFMDIRTKLGTYWFADPDKPLETAFAGRVTLPLAQTYVPIPNPPALFSRSVDVSYPFTEQSDKYFFGLGSAIYYINALGASPVKSKEVTTWSVVSLINASTLPDGKPRMYAAMSLDGAGATDLMMVALDVTLDPTNINFWKWSTQEFVKESNPITAGVKGDLLSQDTVYNVQTGVKVYHFTADQTKSGVEAYVEVAQYSTSIFQAEEPIFFGPNKWFIMDSAAAQPKDIFYWDHKVLGVFRPSAVKTGFPEFGSSIGFLVPQQGEGLIAYTIPRGKYITSIYYTGGSSGSSGGFVTVGGSDGVTEWSGDAEHQVSLFGGSSGSSSGGGGSVSSVGSVLTGYSIVIDDGQLTNPAILIPTYTKYHGWVAGGHVVYDADYDKKITEGREPWNFQIEGDEEIVAAPNTIRELRFVGVAQAPWGEMAVYLRGGNKLFMLDFFGRKLYPIEVGSNRPIISACMWQGAIVCTDGWDVYEINPAQGTQRNIGLPRKWGIPPNLVNEDASNPYQIVYVTANDDELIALLYDTEEPAAALFRYTTTGWHQLGARMHSFVPAYAFKVNFPLTVDGLFAGDGQAIIVPGANSASGSTEHGYWQFTLPDVTHQPTIGLDTFAPSGGRLYSGWIDGGFSDIDGTLLRMNCDIFFHNTSDQVMVEYRIDNDATSEADATWTQMVDGDGNAAVFSSTRRELYFVNAESPIKGTKFRTVQFRITHIRGSDATSCPEMRALTLVYLKTPEIRTNWTVRIDVNRMIETMNDADSLDSSNVFSVDGADASLYTVWNKLRTLWINGHELVTFTAPGILGPTETLYVKLADIPVTFDDFRSEIGGKGYIDIQLLEPVAASEDIH